MIAITHVPSPKMERGERTFVGRDTIDFKLALKQHGEYHELLVCCGAQVRTLVANSHLPDCAFIEDTAVVLDEVAIVCSMGTPSRQAEPMVVAVELAEYRKVVEIQPPATIEGGDVLCVGKTLIVGQSSRTNSEGIQALKATSQPLGYRVIPVPVHGCLHLKTACCALPDGRLLVNPNWLDLTPLAAFDRVEVPAEEQFGANVLLINDRVITEATNIRTAALIRDLDFKVDPIDLSEFTKAEAGVTCLSLLFA